MLRYQLLAILLLVLLLAPGANAAAGLPDQLRDHNFNLYSTACPANDMTLREPELTRNQLVCAARESSNPKFLESRLSSVFRGKTYSGENLPQVCGPRTRNCRGKPRAMKDASDALAAKGLLEAEYLEQAVQAEVQEAAEAKKFFAESE